MIEQSLIKLASSNQVPVLDTWLMLRHKGWASSLDTFLVGSKNRADTDVNYLYPSILHAKLIPYILWTFRLMLLHCVPYLVFFFVHQSYYDNFSNFVAIYISRLLIAVDPDATLSSSCNGLAILTDLKHFMAFDSGWTITVAYLLKSSIGTWKYCSLTAMCQSLNILYKFSSLNLMPSKCISIIYSSGELFTPRNHSEMGKIHWRREKFLADNSIHLPLVSPCFIFHLS